MRTIQSQIASTRRRQPDWSLDYPDMSIRVLFIPQAEGVSDKTLVCRFAYQLVC